MKIGTLFTGAGGADIGAIQVGLTPAWGIEYDADIANAARLNLGDHIKTMNVLDANPANFARVDVLHASPPCPNFSAAKVNAEETALDIALAAKIAEFISVLKPRFFTLENVRDYAHSKSLKIIIAALHGCGYAVNSWVLNSADYGVPQTRKRLIVVARRDGIKPSKPEPTHTEAPTPLFDHRRQWVGWYEAIEDLILTLPETQLAPWQIARMPDVMIRTMVLAQGGYDNQIVSRNGNEPIFTITANNNQAQMKAVLVTGMHNTARDATILAESQPCATVISNFAHRPSHMPFALLVDGTGNSYCTKVTIRDGIEPAFTVTASQLKHPARVALEPKTVSITPQCLARFQSLPNSYIWPINQSLAVKMIGNAVPPLLYAAVAKSLIEAWGTMAVQL